MTRISGGWGRKAVAVLAAYALLLGSALAGWSAAAATGAPDAVAAICLAKAAAPDDGTADGGGTPVARHASCLAGCLALGGLAGLPVTGSALPARRPAVAALPAVAAQTAPGAVHDGPGRARAPPA